MAKASIVPKKWKISKNNDPDTKDQFPYKVLSGHNVLLALVTTRQWACIMRSAPELIGTLTELKTQGEKILESVFIEAD